MKSNYWEIFNKNINDSNIEIVNRFLLDLKMERKSEKTILTYRQILKKFLLNRKNLQEIEPVEVHDWLIFNYGSKKAATYILNYRILSRFFNYCLQKGILFRVPIKKRWCKKRPYYLPKYLTEEETAKVELVLDKMSIRDRAIICFFLSSGCRREEVASLTWDKVNLEEQTAKVLGKRKKVRKIKFDEKTSFLLEILKDAQSTNEGPVFINRFGNRLSPLGIWRIVAKCGKAANLSQNLYCHRLRHTYATVKLSQGEELEDVRVDLGHVNLDTTCIYAGVMPDKLKLMYRRMME